MVERVPESERRWLRALLVLGTFAVALFLLGLVSNVILYFSDILVILILAWLFAFMVSPLVDGILRAIPAAPRTIVVVSVYAAMFIVVIGLVLLVAATLAASIGGFITDLPGFQERLPSILQPWQDQLRSLGFQIDLQGAAQEALTGLQDFAGTLAAPLLALATASIGFLGNLLIIVFLSLFIVIDKDRILTFVNRIVPPRWSDEANLFQQAVSASFGGFLRGQAIQGLVYGTVAAIASIILGVEYIPVTTAAVAILQMIPFFGPFVSWAPPVIAAVVGTNPGAVLPIFIVMWVGWFVVMNFLQPRLMEKTVGIHPVLVLVSVLIGLKIQGVVGAIFAIPVAAVISTFFFYYLQRSQAGTPDLTTRAAMRVQQREGRRVRVPKSPLADEPEGLPTSAAVVDPRTAAPP
jgi:predicted PurR-regulated permease PerM